MTNLLNKPIRVQRKRVKGWKMPSNTVYVGRPSIWGNPFKFYEDVHISRLNAITDYKKMILFKVGQNMIKEYLKGKNLACWCPLDQPCHVDVLLEVANL